MKRIIITSFFFLVSYLFTSCTSMIWLLLGPEKGYEFTSYGTNPDYGYERFAWGTSYETLKEKTGWYITESRKKSGEYFIGFAEPTFDKYYPHGSKDFYVNKTRFYFNEERIYVPYKYENGIFTPPQYKKTCSVLYAAEDEYKKTPPIEFLHQHYGKFSEKNLVTSAQKAQGIIAIYRGPYYLDNEELYTLEITITKKGTTIVKLREPFFKKSLKEKNAENNWVCYATLNSRAERINFTFLNRNKDDKYLFIGYSKGYKSPNISYVRYGICWGKDAKGIYDIKGDTNVLSKNYSTEKWNCAFNDKEYTYTTKTGESARDIVSLFLSSEKISIRHNNTVSEFESSGEQLLDKMAEYGITWEEIDAAIANEEF